MCDDVLDQTHADQAAYMKSTPPQPVADTSVSSLRTEARAYTHTQTLISRDAVDVLSIPQIPHTALQEPSNISSDHSTLLLPEFGPSLSRSDDLTQDDTLAMAAETLPDMTKGVTSSVLQDRETELEFIADRQSPSSTALPDNHTG